jgi:hypothetical protein
MFGNVSYSALVDWHYDLLNHPDYVSYLSGIVDMRHALLSVTPENIVELAEMNNKYQIVQGPWAYLVDTPNETALEMIYQKESQHPVGVFSTESSALSYLNSHILNTFRSFNQIILPSRTVMQDY